MIHELRALLRALSLLALLSLISLHAFAQASHSTWPTKPVRILVGFPPGSTPDGAARAIADPLSKALGQTVIVENKIGASGNIATDQVAKSNDDHTLGIVINGNLTSAKMLSPRLPYDPSKDFSLLGLVGSAPLILVAQPDAPAGKAFFDSARTSSASWNYGSVGTGSVAHLGMELLKSRMPGLRPAHIPYPGNPQVITALIGKQIDMALVPPGLALPQVKAGKLQAIGLTSGRSTLAPDVPSLADAGVQDFQLEVWTALVGPAHLSAAAKRRLAGALPEVLKNPDTRQQLFNLGWQAPNISSASALEQRVFQETKTMQSIIMQLGIQGP